jgi:LysR family transcriptional regulator for bpeEF and oprC
MKSLVELSVFVRAAESKNLSEAARSLGLTPSAVSKRLTKLEDRLGVTLLHRTTRSVALSEDGRRFYERCRRILADVDEAEHQVVVGRGAISGKVKLATPCTVARQVLAAKVATLLDRHPGLSLELTLSERELDPMTDEVDVALSWGRPSDSALIQRRLMVSPVRVFAAPAYLERRGVPRSPDALSQHEAVLLAGAERQWPFRVNGKTVAVSLSSRVLCDTPDAVRELTAAGLGLCRAPQLVMGSTEGLTTVLDDFACEERPLYARCAPAQPLSPRVKAVLEWLAESMTAATARA